MKVVSISIVLGIFIIFGLPFFQKQLEIFLFEEIYNPVRSNTQLASVVQPITEQTSNGVNQPSSEIKTLEFQAKSVLSLKINQDGSEKILYQKDIQEKLPIASLTKLMTAIITLENFGSTSSPQVSLDQKITISKEAVSQEGDAGKLVVGESVSVQNLLYILLIESSNDAAYALAENTGSINSPQVDSAGSPQVGQVLFLEKMNNKAKELQMLNTNFSNPTGLDGATNYSTSEDLVKLVKYILLNYPQIWEITSKVSAEILNEDGAAHHLATNTNELLGKIPDIIGGKTGFNEEALGCLILILKNQSNEYLINIILGSPDRFAEMEKLIEWLNGSIVK